MKKGASESAGSDQVPVPAPSPSPSAASNDDKTQSEEKSETQPVGLDSITVSILSGWASALKLIGLVAVSVVGSYLETAGKPSYPLCLQLLSILAYMSFVIQFCRNAA